MRYGLVMGLVAIVSIVDIMILIWMMNNIGVLARKKGQSVWLWRTYAAGLWILGSAVCMITAVPVLSIMNLGLIYVWPLSLVGAIFAYFLVYLRLARMPNVIK